MMTNDNSQNMSRRKSLQLTLAVTAFGMALGKQASDNSVFAKEIFLNGKSQSLSDVEYSKFVKLNKSEQSFFFKLSAAEKSQFIKLTSKSEMSTFLKLNAAN
jgi:hypothetical protein